MVTALNTWTANDSVPVTLDGSRLELYQPGLTLLSQSTSGSIRVTRAGSGQSCGAISLRVARAVSILVDYQLVWTAVVNGQPSLSPVLSRSALIIDLTRPYVGVFLRTNGDLTIQTYTKDAAGRPTNVWLAAVYRAGGAVRKLVMAERGMVFVDAANRPVAATAYPSGCP